MGVPVLGLLVVVEKGAYSQNIQQGFAFSVYGQAKKWKTWRSRKGYWI